MNLWRKHQCTSLVLKYKGVYLIVDNGYHDWSCTVPPFGVTNDIDEIRWSWWVESMRKDVECTFGILKGRWHVPKAGVRLHGVEKVDQVWLTCCALHNWLLHIDGLSKEWDGGVPVSDWDGELGELEFEGVNKDIPNAIARLSMKLDPWNYDSSGIGPGSDVRQEMSALNECNAVMEDKDDPDLSKPIWMRTEVASSSVQNVNHTSLLVFC
jgi:hypothetical protein